MSTSPDRNPAPGLQRITPAKHYSRSIIFVDEVAKHEPHRTSTSVDIFSRDGINWYCQVRCGEQKTQPMGPFTKRKAERVQDAPQDADCAKGHGVAYLRANRRGQVMTQIKRVV